jgi:hypothetical protein
MVSLCACSSVVTEVRHEEPVFDASSGQTVFETVDLYTVVSARDAQVSFKDSEGNEIVVNNEGEPSFIAQWFQMLIMRTDINIGDEDAD